MTAVFPAGAAVQYIDLTDKGEWHIDPTYSSIEPASVYTALEPQKLAGMPLGSYAARPGGGVDVVWTYGGFKREDTKLTGNYQAFAFNAQAVGNQWAFWGAKVGGGVDYLYFDPNVAQYLVFEKAGLDGVEYVALSPANNGTEALSAFAARAEGGVDFIFFDETANAAIAAPTALTKSYRALAFTDDSADGKVPAGNWAARADGGLDYFVFSKGLCELLPLSGDLSEVKYVALEPIQNSSVPGGVYAARADGGIDVISLAGEGTTDKPYRAVAQNANPLLPGSRFHALSWNAAAEKYANTAGDFWGAEAAPTPPTEIGNWNANQKSAAPRVENPTLILRMGALPDAPRISTLSWDTEGGDRAKMNLLRAPVYLRIPSGGAGQPMTGATVEFKPNRVSYAGAKVTWDIQTLPDGFNMVLTSNETSGAVDAEVVFPFNPTSTATSIIANDWDAQDRFALPAILFAPDFGGFVVTSENATVTGSLIGNRYGAKVAEVGLSVVGQKAGESVTLKFRQHVLSVPANVDPAEWAKVRRSWLNMFNVSSAWKREDGSRGARAGILSNNVISDPVSSLMYCYSQPARLIPELAPGVNAAVVLRRTLDFWLTEQMSEAGFINYVGDNASQMMDSNAAILGAAGDYFATTGDKDWVEKRIELLEKAAGYLINRDTNGDGLVESQQSGNYGTKAFGDTYMDTISSGGVNALCNALIYRGWKTLASLETTLGRTEQAAKYSLLADKLQAAYLPTLKTPAGWIGWWKSQDGELNDYSPMIVNCIAVETGVVSPEEGKVMLNKLWEKLKEVGFEGFEVGMPNNLVPVRRDHQYASYGGTKEDGSDTFPHYCNGGVFLEDAIRAILAFNIVGEPEKAATIFNAMMKRHVEGNRFPNGSGFNAGVTNVPNTGPSISDWKGNPTEYEGFIPKDHTFLTGLLLRDPKWRAHLGFTN